jgi:predicted glutamine amidotransferase
VRYASTGGIEPDNTHPFEQEGRVFAHNGHIEGLDRLEEQLGDYRRLVRGETDSERFFALVTKETEAQGGDPGAGLVAAARWVAAELPLFALNCLLATPTGMWALRYPDAHDLLLLERASGGPTGGRHFDAASQAGRIRVRSGELAETPAVVFASERMDEDPGWHNLKAGELVHIDGDLRVTRRIAVDRPPAHQLRLEDLLPHAAASQHHAKA